MNFFLYAYTDRIPVVKSMVAVRRQESRQNPIGESPPANPGLHPGNTVTSFYLIYAVGHTGANNYKKAHRGI